MPPPDAVAAGKVQPITDEDRRTILRWIDLGCPIDLDFHPGFPEHRGYGWMLDDNRPILTLARPREHEDRQLDRILIGMHDYDTGLDEKSFTVKASFPASGQPAGANLAAQFQEIDPGVWELKLAKPLAETPSATIEVSVRDIQGNLTQIERRFSIGK
jgi:hypothetical protein